MGLAQAASELVATHVHPLDAAATVPDIDAVLREFSDLGRAARQRFAGRRDIAYGPTALETLDVFTAGPAAPLLAFIHGGYWRRMDKSDVSFVAGGLVPLGVSVASINYGLAPLTPLIDIVAQCRRALEWLRINAAALDIDGGRITVAGHSAGGHLAAMCAVASPVHAVVTLSGLHDLVPVQQSFVNEWLQIDEPAARALSPIAYSPARACPVLASAGERESEAFKAQGRALVDAWKPHGCDAAYADSPADNHFSICTRLGDPDDALTRRIATLAS